MAQVKIAMRWLAPLLGVLAGMAATAEGMDRLAAITLGITV